MIQLAFNRECRILLVRLDLVVNARNPEWLVNLACSNKGLFVDRRWVQFLEPLEFLQYSSSFLTYATLGLIDKLDEILDYTSRDDIIKFSPYMFLRLNPGVDLDFTRDSISKVILGRDKEVYKKIFSPIAEGTEFAGPGIIIPDVDYKCRDITDFFNLIGIDIGEFFDLLRFQNNSIPLKRLNVLINRSAAYLNKTEKWIEYTYR